MTTRARLLADAAARHLEVEHVPRPPANSLVEAATGLGIEPGSSTAWPVFADERLSGRVGLGSGERGSAVFVDAASLFEAYPATVADLSE